jgi:hypothetical protein
VASGTAGNAISFTQALTLDASGNLLVGGTSTAQLDGVFGQIIGSSTKSSAGIALETQYGAYMLYTDNADALIFWDSASNTERARIDSSGNLGLGVTPSAWGTTYKAIEIGRVGNTIAGFNGGTEITIAANAYYDGSWKYAVSSGATKYTTDNTGVHAWYNAPSGTAGNNISFTQAMTLDSSGNLGLGVTPSAWVNATASQVGFGAAISSRAAGNTASDMTHNAFWDGSNWKYIASSVGAARYQMTGANVGSTHAWFVSAGGTAGNAITFTTAMTLDASGNLGVGTASPVTNLHVYKTTAATSGVQISSANWGSTLTDGMFVGVDNNNSYVYTYENIPLVFGTNATERARITSGGDFELGVNAGTGTRTLTVQTNTSGDPTLVLTAAGSDGGSLWYGRADTRLYARSSNTGGVYLAAGGTSWTAVSDERKKDIIEPISNATEKVGSLRAVIGKYKTDADDKRRSFLIAQDVQSVFPEAVDSSTPDQLGLSYSDMIPLLVKAIQELKAELDATKAKVAALEAK